MKGMGMGTGVFEVEGGGMSLRKMMEFFGGIDLVF